MTERGETPSEETTPSEGNKDALYCQSGDSNQILQPPLVSEPITGLRFDILLSGAPYQTGRLLPGNERYRRVRRFSYPLMETNSRRAKIHRRIFARRTAGHVDANGFSKLNGRELIVPLQPE